MKANFQILRKKIEILKKVKFLFDELQFQLCVRKEENRSSLFQHQTSQTKSSLPLKELTIFPCYTNEWIPKMKSLRNFSQGTLFSNLRVLSTQFYFCTQSQASAIGWNFRSLRGITAAAIWEGLKIAQRPTFSRHVNKSNVLHFLAVSELTFQGLSSTSYQYIYLV